jgi:ABC-type antimicrobial peptide transport system permease subunit
MIPLSYSIRSLLRRPITAVVTIFGMSLVVFVFAAVLMLSRGVRETLTSSGSPGNALFLRDGATSEATSNISRDQLRLLSAGPEIALAADGKPLLAGELVLIAGLPRSDGKGNANVSLRGISPSSLVVRDTIKVVDGRKPNPSTQEVMLGRNLVGRYVGANVNQSMKLARRDWQVVGVFESGGSAFESEVWADAEVLMGAFNRDGFSDAVAKLKDPGTIAGLGKKLAADPQLSSVKVQREDRFYDSQSDNMRGFFSVLGIFVAVIFAIAAALGAAVTMHSQVAERIKEVGALRAIGFSRRVVLAVFLREAILLSLIGAAVGTVLASLLGLVKFTTMNWQSFTEVTFKFAFGPDVALWALIFALIMGTVGGFSPALGAARRTIVSALRGAG